MPDPKIIKEFPGQLVELHRMTHGGRLPGELPKVLGVSRMADSPSAILVSFDESLRDDELREFHDRLRAPRSETERTHPNGLWMVYFEDPEVKPEVFFGEGAEQAARARYKAAFDNWSCHLLSRVPNGK